MRTFGDEQTGATAPFVRAVVPCRLAFRDGVGALLESLCGELDDTTRYQVVSAFNEAFNNLVHHSQLEPDCPVEVEAAREPDSIVVRLTDDGAAIPPEVELSPGEELLAENLPERGMGLLIISRCMDEVSYERAERNVLTMRKKTLIAGQDDE